MNIYKWSKCNKDKLTGAMRGYGWRFDLIRSCADWIQRKRMFRYYPGRKWVRWTCSRQRNEIGWSFLEDCLNESPPLYTLWELKAGTKVYHSLSFIFRSFSTSGTNSQLSSWVCALRLRDTMEKNKTKQAKSTKLFVN